jgi:hypothetical protein
LFLLFINNLDAEVEGLVETVKKFADDTKMGSRADTAAKRADLQTALNNLCAWADRWGMQFNVKKCKVLHMGHNNPEQVYSMNGEALVAADEEVDVGVTVKRNLKPSAQCAKAARTAQAVLGQIVRAFHYRDRHVFVRLFNQYVRPHLEFAVAAWMPWQEADKEILERVQKRAVAMVSGLRSGVYEERLKELGLTTLEERRYMNDMVQVFKILKEKDDVKKESWFEMANVTERTTRATADPLNLKMPSARLEVRRNFFSQRTPKEWNKIPANIKNARSVNEFKNGLKKWRSKRGSMEDDRMAANRR